MEVERRDLCCLTCSRAHSCARIRLAHQLCAPIRLRAQLTFREPSAQERRTHLPHLSRGTTTAASSLPAAGCGRGSGTAQVRCLPAVNGLLPPTMSPTRRAGTPMPSASRYFVRPGPRWRLRGAAEAVRWRRPPRSYGRPRCRPGRVGHRRSAAGGCARAPGGGSRLTARGLRVSQSNCDRGVGPASAHSGSKRPRGRR